MQDEEKDALETFVQKFWADPENLKRFQEIESGVREDVDSLLSRGNVALMSRCVTTVERSNERRIEVGLPILKFKGSR